MGRPRVVVAAGALAALLLVVPAGGESEKRYPRGGRVFSRTIAGAR